MSHKEQPQATSYLELIRDLSSSLEFRVIQTIKKPPQQPQSKFMHSRSTKKSVTRISEAGGKKNEMYPESGKKGNFEQL